MITTLDFDYRSMINSQEGDMGLSGYMIASGLAAGAGSRAWIVLLALGGFHYTPYFKMIEAHAWVASAP